MINAVHALLYASDPDAARAFFRDVLELSSVDAGRGWLIFALPPAEIAVHPSDGEPESGACHLYLMCEDVQAAVTRLKQRGVEVLDPVADRGWGLVTRIQVPGAGPMGLYQPRHPVAYKR